MKLKSITILKACFYSKFIFLLALYLIVLGCKQEQFDLQSVDTPYDDEKIDIASASLPAGVILSEINNRASNNDVKMPTHLAITNAANKLYGSSYELGMKGIIGSQFIVNDANNQGLLDDWVSAGSECLSSNYIEEKCNNVGLILDMVYGELLTKMDETDKNTFYQDMALIAIDELIYKGDDSEESEDGA